MTNKTNYYEKNYDKIAAKLPNENKASSDSYGQ